MNTKSIYTVDFFYPCELQQDVVDWIAKHNSNKMPIEFSELLDNIYQSVSPHHYAIGVDDKEQPTEIAIHFMGHLAMSVKNHPVYDLVGIEDGTMTLKQPE